jgi:hypothetical protein
MTVNDVLEKVNEISRYEELYEKSCLNANHFDRLIELLQEYKEELLSKKIVK